MIRFKALKIPFNGDFPVDFQCDNILRKSGFLDSLYNRFEDEDTYQIKKKNFITHAAREVVSPVTARILESAAITVWGEARRCNGIQTSFIELMQNTKDHASPFGVEEKHWWLLVNHSEADKKVTFSFVDYGVGIFKSLQNKPPENKWYGVIEKMWEKFHYRDNAELLELILNGELHRTATGEYYRGQGLPGLKDTLQDNWFSDLRIMSNNVYANIKSDEYINLNNDFSGTFIYWELHENNNSLKPSK